MSFPFRFVNFVLQLLTAVLEVVALGLLIRILSTHCVLGEEYGISVWMYTFILPAIACQSVVLVIFRLCCTTVGLDPIAMTFNFASGFLCLGSALTLLVSMVDHCGNEFAFIFYMSSAFGVIAGVLHLLNACVCNVYIPSGEWYLLINGMPDFVDWLNTCPEPAGLT
ncbi:GM16318 [Drosophila sechellia]|uniref:GM16318 n=1 Tax=Drosophila sechellia TaxID=7238 RepID=B4IGW8_DROSE|nr:GM16318 [Drosophila sechellia]